MVLAFISITLAFCTAGKWSINLISQPTSSTDVRTDVVVSRSNSRTDPRTF